MPNDYVIPAEVTSPRRQWTLVNVIYDRGERRAAVATGLWDQKPVLAMRWNGSDENPIGNPQSRGLATWFIVPDEFREAILARLRDIAPDKFPLAEEFIMSAVVLTNTIPVPEVKKEIQEAVLDGIRTSYRTNGPWTVKIFAPQDRAGYFIRVQAPNGYIWEELFEGPGQENGAYVKKKVAEASLVRKAGEYAAKKLPEFATAGERDREAMILTQIHRL